MTSGNLVIAQLAAVLRGGKVAATLAHARAPAMIALSSAVLLIPALRNGFPFIFADTGGYLERPFAGTLEIGRSALYGAFLAAGIHLDFWPTVIVQALLAAWIVHLILRTHAGPRSPAVTLATVAALTLLTSLPWYAGQLMPDIFLLLAVLALEMLAFRHSRLNGPEGAGLIAVVACSAAFHMSILAVALVLLATFVLVRMLPTRWRAPKPGILLPSVAVNGLSFTAINWVHVPAALACMLLLPLLAWWRRDASCGIGALAAVGFLALATNAAICGIFSAAADRYGSRLAPIAVLIALAAAVEASRRRWQLL
jgi:hypothetical protein